ncbi:TraV family lipoprotein [Noviherbaspirillum sp. ST9]|uniref:TraV family lipoprotein n=1 Tax=Noviherbaspirillum sp. ST9 TaxID=3401606 RepID=UPI003B587F4C
MNFSIHPARGAVVMTVCLLAACANVSGLGGSAEYSCRAPQGVRCDSVSGIYANAARNNLPSQRQHAPAERASTAHAATPSASVSAVAAAPLRAQARVLRLWFKPWEDADHDLYDQGFVYVQIDSGRWLIDHVQQRIRDAHAPIRPPRSSTLPRPAPARPDDTHVPGAGDRSSAPARPPSGVSEPSDDNSQ